MSRPNSGHGNNTTLGTAVGVLEELVHDVGDVAWVFLDLLGFSPVITRIREELNRPRSIEEIDPLTGERKVGRKKRSIVRVLGSALPLKPPPRPYLRYVELRSLSTSCDSLFSSTTQGAGLADAPWISGPENRMKYRPVLSRCETAPDLYGYDKESDYYSGNLDSPRSSTPFDSMSVVSYASNQGHPNYPMHLPPQPHPNSHSFMSSQQNISHSNIFNASNTFSDPIAVAKISALESELEFLRAQVANIINTKNRMSTPPSTPIESRSSIPPPPPPMPFSAPPPPPPLPPGGGNFPPPPPSMSSRKSSTCSLSSKGLSFNDMIAQNKENINKHNEPLEITVENNKSSGDILSMTEVLKGLNKVKLKRVDRSPGGTPVREPPKSPPPMDPASLIAAALKKRFAKMTCDSPEKDGDESNDFYSSPEHSPKVSRKSRWDSQPSPKKKLNQSVLMSLNSTPNNDNIVNNKSFDCNKNTSSLSFNNDSFITQTSTPKLKKLKGTPKIESKSDSPKLPPFGQHLLKRRRSSTLDESRDDASP